MFDEQIRRGVEFLQLDQDESGQFSTLNAADIDMVKSKAHDSPFITALILDFLTGVKYPGSISELGISYLSGIRTEPGFYRFFKEGIDPDLDSTCLINLVLKKHGQNFDFQSLARTISTRALPDGSFPTWIRQNPDDPNDFDPCVGVNVLRYLAINGQKLDTDWLRRALENWDAEQDTLYYVQPFFLLYFIAQLPYFTKEILYARVPQLEKKIIQARHHNTIDTALRLVVAVDRKLEVDLIHHLATEVSNAQQSDGSWPITAAFQAYDFWGSSALTTSACIRALKETEAFLTQR